MQRLLRDFSWKGKICTKIFEDNQNVLTWVETKKPAGRSKHIDTRMHHIGDHIRAGLIECIYCPTEEMLADLFTKGLPKEKFMKLRDMCNLND